VSLLSHLGARDSPVRAFFASRLPDTADVVRAAAAELRDGRKVAPLKASAGVNPGRAGTAVDYLVRFGLASEPCPRDGGPATLGAGMLEGRLAPAARHAAQQGLQMVHATAAFDRDVSDQEWEDLARVALLFAVFEQCYRSGILPEQFEELSTVPGDWRDWADLVCTEAEVEDVAILGWAAVQDHSSIRGRKLICNPVFAQSAALGGADADLITDTGLLIDFKSTSTTRTCSTIDLWQLCGYALADTNDDYKIRSVGLSALRWRTQHSWELAELLPMLAGEPLRLEHLRRDFAAVLAQLSSRPRGGTPQRRVAGQGAPGPKWGPELGEDGRTLWRCGFCGELGTAREGELIALRGGATAARVLLPPNWRQREGKPICPDCRKAS
jgi:hypothetical protein